MAEHSPLPPQELAWTCRPDSICEVPPKSGVLIGQEKAVAALKLGLELYGPGYNVFVSGLTGTRRAHSVKALIEQIRASCLLVPDRVFVHNFQEPHRPVLLELAKGEGARFVDDMQRFFRTIMARLPASLTSATLSERRRAIQKQYAVRERVLYHDLVGECERAGLSLVKLDQEGSVEPDIFPVIDGKPVAPEALDILVREGSLDQERAAALESARQDLVTKLYAVRSEGQNLALEMMGAIDQLERTEARTILLPALETLRQRWREPLQPYFDGLERHLLDNLGALVAVDQAAKAAGAEEPQRPRELEVHLLPRAEVKRSDGWDCPVVFEANPTVENLFGTILPPEPDGPRLAHIEIGSLLRADGGYLVLRLVDLRETPGVWPVLKRVLKTGQLEIRPIDTSAAGRVSPLKPDPIQVQAKLILIGEPGTYELLCEEDPEFKKVFKVHVQFDTTMPRTAENIGHYCAFAASLVHEEGLRPSTPGGICRFVECGARMAGVRRRLSTRFGDLADLYREASYVAMRRGGREIERADFLAAEQTRAARLALAQEKYLEGVRDGHFRIEITGHRVGQVNGLVVLDTGAWVYGRPSRISAQVGVGSKGIVNIERESELSGPIHRKGVQILSGYLLGRFARLFPLRLSATLCFEQSYSGVDGDSAASTELFALLSALSGVPLHQGIAVTGSVDQNGRIQAVGGVNEKVEGYFRVCQELGFTEEQGVMIPRTNVEDLMLPPEIIAAAEEGRFRVYAIETVEAGLEILTGVPAGTPDDDGDSLFGLAGRRLQEFARIWREYR